jgi:hypothetical protein
MGGSRETGLPMRPIKPILPTVGRRQLNPTAVHGCLLPSVPVPGSPDAARCDPPITSAAVTDDDAARRWLI